MDDKFDKKLTGRIKEVFDNYEHPPADAGWAELRKKFPAEEARNKIAWLWWSSAAAILLVFLGVGMWLINKPAKQNDVVIKPEHTIKKLEPKDSIAPEAMAPTYGIATVKPKAQVNNDGPVNNGTYNTPKALADNIGKTAASRSNTPSAVVAPVVVNSDNLQVDANPGSNTTAVTVARIPDSAKTAGSSPQGQQIAQVPVVTSSDNNTANSVAVKQPAKTMEDLFRTDKVVAKKEKQESKDAKKVNFSVYAATYFNYAQGSTNQVNAGAGFTSDFRVSRKIKLSTGVALAQNTLSYNSPPVVAAGRSSGANSYAAAPAIVQSDLFSASGSVAQFENLNASLVGLDIPINIKYEFNPDKSETYISAGLSSGTFIDERYTSRFAYRTNTLTGTSVTTRDQTSTASFNNFYFARTLNVAFGIGYSLGKSNTLVIEPFLKYPLGGMGAQDIKFGSGGLNLKLNFRTTKK